MWYQAFGVAKESLLKEEMGIQDSDEDSEEPEELEE